MKLASHKALDALVGAYIVGTLRGAARRRFERALANEPLVASRLNYWLQRANLKPSTEHAVMPSPKVWKRIASDLNLNAYRAPWYSRITFWRNWAFAVTSALMLFVAMQWIVPSLVAPEFQNIARLSGDANAVNGTTVSASISRDGKKLSLKPDRAMLANAAQSYELWLLPDGANFTGRSRHTRCAFRSTGSASRPRCARREARGIDRTRWRFEDRRTNRTDHFGGRSGIINLNPNVAVFRIQITL
jgi:anti-sigma-K factor RskA